jgi:uncharacterized membrane protein
MSDQPLFLFVGAYDTENAAEVDYALVKELHADGVIGTYDAAIIAKEDDGKVRVKKDELPTRHGAWTGLAAGAVLGMLFPPSLIGSAVVGATAGGVAGHLWKGMSRSDLRELGEVLDVGQAALIVVGRSRIADELGRRASRPVRQAERQLDADGAKLDDEIQAASAEMTPGG